MRSSNQISRHTSDDENNKRNDRTPVLDLAGVEVPRHSEKRPCTETLEGSLEIPGFPPSICVFRAWSVAALCRFDRNQMHQRLPMEKTLSRDRYKHTIKL
jgi:hypothetical protein